ncbi:hypothetical protein GH714_020902 [Hevea brasiliensis]|uniref:Bromo domain-containing protein n=1 Tax=Hevea brasiliensis TaxID=3981 RepID=A0A6A6N173_HEVBR|nr:hypothetical protein GH714_020902 [Hevea brasiliensis]
MLGQPVGPEASKLASFLGTLARNGEMAPLNFLEWSGMPDAIKEDMWQFVQTKFDIDPTCKTWVMKSLASKWRNWKAQLKADHYNPHTTDEERLKDCNKRLRCAKNKANRAKQKSAHAAGSKSFARIREEERAKRADGAELTRGELYILTRTRKDGQPVDKVAAEVITKLHELEAQKQQTSHGSDDHEDSYSQVMGKEKGGHVRMVGMGPSPADIWARKPSRLSLVRIGLEAKRLAMRRFLIMLLKIHRRHKHSPRQVMQFNLMRIGKEDSSSKLEYLFPKRMAAGGRSSARALVCNMKRKRGNKKGKQKGPSVAAKNEAAVNLVSLDGEDNSAADDDDDNNNNNNNNNNNHSHNNEEYESGMDIDTPSSTGTDQPLNLASINPDGSIDKTAGKSVGCVKVKLKTSKLLELQSDTDKGSPQLALEKQGGVSDKIEDTSNSLSEIKTGGPGNVSTKPGSIKIKSSKVLGGLSVQKSGSTVIKKLMKWMPFNVPVNPEALGIPDYFDIIDAPMDFGTICRNLEKDDKYMNSEDVYKDVQFIWDNCYKYNSEETLPPYEY